MHHRPLCLASLFLLALAPPVHGQFSQLAATDDGKQLYFVSQLLLRGSHSDLPGPETRLYHSTSNGVSLFAERGALAPQFGSSSNDGVRFPQVTGDGSTIGFSFSDICDSSPDCSSVIGDEAVLRGNQSRDLGPGILQLSRNGRWALVMSGLSSTENSVLVDLVTGQRSSVPPPPGYAWSSPGFRAVASDGTLLVARPGSSPDSFK